MKNVIEAALTFAYVVMVSAPLFAQSILPQPDAPFKGKIGLRPSDSTKDFPEGGDGARKARPTSCSS